MSRRLQFLNLAGVIALAALCIFQWQRDRRLNHELNAGEKIRQSQERQLAESATSIRNLTDDLTRFKTDYAAARTEATELQGKLRAFERENAQLTQVRDQLRESITNWAVAVTARDERLIEANTRLRELSGQLNEAVVKFNTLVTNHNAVVDELNKARTARAQPQ